MMQTDGTKNNENELALVLDEYLTMILVENTSFDDCLTRYPEYAPQLKLLLAAAMQINRFRTMEPSHLYKNRARGELLDYIRSHAHKPVQAYRFALILASLVIGFLTTGTALAQGALPGDRLYDWKLASERAWRLTANDPVGVDIKLAERRSREVLAVTGDPERSLRAHQEYKNAEDVLISEIVPENEDRITSVIQTQRKSLEQSGINLPPFDEIMPAKPKPLDTPTGPTEKQLPLEIPTGILQVTVGPLDPMSTEIPSLPALPEPANIPPAIPTTN
jgi:hypothetical protein